MFINPMLLTDFYKISHRIMSEKGTEFIYSTFTPRKSRIPEIDKVVFFGLQHFMQEYLISYFNTLFFNYDKDEIVADYKRIIKNALGEEAASTEHIEALHDLGYLPIRIKAVPEGTFVPIRVPCFTIENTIPEFYWLTNFLETMISAGVWKGITSTTIAKHYYDIAFKWAFKTSDNSNHVKFQCHNFSYRGMGSNEEAIITGAGHLLFFKGTDTIPSIQFLEDFYGADSDKELIGCSVMATEHSIQCQHNDDYRYFKRMICEVCPTGIVSVVADGYDYWDVMINVIPKLKQEIMNRDGKLVIRGDSGNPVDIICGDAKSGIEHVNKGSIEILWDIFGGYTNSKGYKVLDPHIGYIYGEGITPNMAEEIFEKLEAKGFSAENVIFGIGSYSMGYYTRDTFGFALKATHTIIDGKEINIYKDPKTDDSKMKKSQKGMVAVHYGEDGQMTFTDELDSKSIEKFEGNLLETVFEDGNIIKPINLTDINEAIVHSTILEMTSTTKI